MDGFRKEAKVFCAWNLIIWKNVNFWGQFGHCSTQGAFVFQHRLTMFQHRASCQAKFEGLGPSLCPGIPCDEIDVIEIT